MFEKYQAVVEKLDPILCSGRVEQVRGYLVEAQGPMAMIGELCRIQDGLGGMYRPAEVVGLRGNRVQLMCYEDLEGIEVGARVIAEGEPLQVPVSPMLLGRVLNALGKPIDGKGEILAEGFYPIHRSPPDVLSRQPIREQIETGVRVIDGFLAVGKGQRLGIFSGSGVGKSTLLGMIARNTRAEVNVIALIGERGREVREFIEHDLGPEGLSRSVIVVSTSDTPPLARLRGAYTATAIAEYFRDQGKDVMLLFDSITRFARAQREIGLALGEPPATRGFTPSVFANVPKLLERCGNSAKGTMTGFYTILVEGDDMDEPIADTVRGTLDGHLYLSRKLAQKSQYPAVDVLGSVSRLAIKIVPADVARATSLLRRMLAVYYEAEDLINVGAYVRGTNPEIDNAITLMPVIRDFLMQPIQEKAPLEETRRRLLEIAASLEGTSETTEAENEEV
ncbi:MAG: flagellar protein export ATPase FliI [Spirochaetales bacterium]